MKNLIDLHCHLDGSLDVEVSYKLAFDRNIIDKDLDFNEFKELMMVSSDNGSLEEFLSRFKLPLSLLQDDEALTVSTLNVIKNLEKDSVIYAELRFAPQHHTLKGLTQEEVVKSVLNGVEEAREICKNVRINIILCMMRGTTFDETKDKNFETIDVAKKFINKGVVAIDLAGPEKGDLAEYKELFDYAKELEIPYIIHAGENNYPNNISLAIDYGAKRIGHGINAIRNEEVLNKLVESKIPLEVCVTSNIQCQLSPSFTEHPITKLYDSGVNITLNTDNRTLSNTTLNAEIEKVQKYHDFTDEEVKQMMRNSLNAAFLTNDEKDELLNRIVE